jgi:hypothetical protein
MPKNQMIPEIPTCRIKVELAPSIPWTIANQISGFRPLGVPLTPLAKLEDRSRVHRIKRLVHNRTNQLEM